MRVIEVLFTIWALLVFAWWMLTDPTSAPQQAALAGQALVLLCTPYVIVATLQRGHALKQDEPKSVEVRSVEVEND